MNETQLARRGGPPEVTVFINQAQYGEYTIRLKNPETGERSVQGDGDNADDVMETLTLRTPVEKLDRAILSWLVTIAAPEEDLPGHLYFARIEIRQNGQLIDGAHYEYSDELNGTVQIVGATRLRVS